MNIPELYNLFRSSTGATTDTRQIRQGNIFFALKGPSFNGNQFAQEAINKGAAYAVVDENSFADNEKIIPVKDVLETLQQLAKYHLEQFDIPVLAITGSNGKTTTKELVHAVMSTKFKTYTTKGNLNNHIGIPLTILSIQQDAEFAIVEMGANHLQEIASYCKIVQPTHGIITNCGKAHLEGFGSEEGVRKGKGELYDYLRSTMGTVFLYDDAAYLKEMAKGITAVITYGTSPSCAISGNALSDTEQLTVQLNDAHRTTIHTRLVGAYNLPNVLAAVTVGRYFNIEIERITKAIEEYIPGNSRSQLVEQGGAKIILDAYNANPSSMKVAIENLQKINHPDKVLVLGAMAELGDSSDQEHAAIVALIDQYKWKQVVLVGKYFKPYAGHYTYFDHAEEAAKWFRQQDWANSYILVKGSRSQQMEKVIAND